MKQWLIIGAIVLVLLGSYLWNRNRTPENLGETIPPVEEIITQEDGTVAKRIGDTVQELSPEEAQARKAEIEEKVAGAAPVLLTAVENETGTGTSVRAVDNGTYYQKVTVQGLESLQKGYFYEVELQSQEGNAVSIGRIEMNGGSGELYYSSKEDRSSYTQVVVTRQTEGRPEMREVVLQGEHSVQ